MTIPNLVCFDGMTAAWVVWKKFDGADSGIIFAPLDYGQDFIVTDDCVYVGDKAYPASGKNVLFVDISVDAETTRELAGIAGSVTVLDHHKTAEAALSALAGHKGIRAEFDLTKSGAGLAHWFYFDGDPLPAIVKYVQDRDLWKFEFGETSHLVNRFLGATPMELAEWDIAAAAIEDGSFLPVAKVLETTYRAEVERLVDRAGRIGISAPKIDGNGIEDCSVPFAVCKKVFASDVCHELLKRHPFAAAYSEETLGDGRMSLRSTDDRRDVSAIAKQFCGGGHRNAASFSATITFECGRHPDL